MILEAFSKYLFESDPALSSTEVLARWLWEKLSVPAQTAVDQVIQCEIIILRDDPSRERATGCEIFMPASESERDCKDAPYVFSGSSRSGDRLLNSLREYCLSFEQQKWSRWVHHLKASDFTTSNTRSPDEIGE